MLLLATRNPGKVREIRESLRGLDLDLISVAEWGEIPEPEETGPSFAENARQKAEYYFQHTGMAALADDSGLEVDALGGAPGVHSSRFASTDRDRIQKLLGLLQHLDPVRQSHLRTARFVCAICLVGASRVVEVQGTVEGRVSGAPRGEHGFGYDPIFFYPPLKRTFAELTSDEKNRISHRARALAELRSKLNAVDLAKLTARR